MTRLLVQCALLAWATAAAAAPADPFEFVTQEVCVDAHDRAVAGDPAHCPDKRRLRIGEAVPYRRVDAGNWQAFTAYPVEGVGSRPLAMVTKVFGGNDASGSYADLGVRSGYDLLAVDGGYVSGIRTSDGGAGDQIFWRTADCARTNGWIFFPIGLKPGDHGELRSTLKITQGPSVECPRRQLRNIAPDDTVWERPVEPVRYTSGKLLDSIVSMHFAYGDPADPAHDDDSMEKFYFTKPYGYSRWEAWQTAEGCRKRALRSGADPGTACQPYPEERCSGANTATYFGKLYLRLDCRDDTFYVADAERPFDPLVNAAAPGDIVSRNLLANGTFANGQEAWTATPSAMPDREPRSNNAVLDLPPGGRLSQDFAIPPEVAAGAGAGTLRFGITLEPGAKAAHARLTLVLDGGGPPLTIDKTVAVAAAGATAVRFAIVAPGLQGGTASGHFDLALDGPGGARVDNAFVTLLTNAAAVP